MNNKQLAGKTWQQFIELQSILHCMCLVYCILQLKYKSPEGDISPCGKRTSTSHSAWSLKIYTMLDLLIHISAFCKHVFPSHDKAVTLHWMKQTKQQDHVIITHHTLEKRNKWLRGFVTMISLSAWGNYVTMEMYFPWVTVQNNEVGKSGCMLGMATYYTERKQRKKRRTRQIPCNPLAALFTYIERRWLVPQGNRKSWIYTHLQHKTRECWLLSMINSDANAIKTYTTRVLLWWFVVLNGVEIFNLILFFLSPINFAFTVAL